MPSGRCTAAKNKSKGWGCRESKEGNYWAKQNDVHRTTKGQLSYERASDSKASMNGRVYACNWRIKEMDVEWTDVELRKACTFHFSWRYVQIWKASNCIPIESVSQMWKPCTFMYFTALYKQCLIAVSSIHSFRVVCFFGHVGSLLRRERHGEETGWNYIMLW